MRQSGSDRRISPTCVTGSAFVRSLDFARDDIASGTQMLVGGASSSQPLSKSSVSVHVFLASIAIHFPRRRNVTARKQFCFNARRICRSWSRIRPDKISQGMRRNFGRAAINSSLKRLAVTRLMPVGGRHPKTSASRKSTLPIPFKRAFAFEVEIAVGSMSMPITRSAPNRFAASANIPEPVPRSTIDQPASQLPVICSSSRNDIAVVGC
jgi:hypothetical protein